MRALPARVPRAAAPALGVALALAPAPAAAQSVTAAYPETVRTALENAGYIATLTTDDYGDPKIESRGGGVGFDVFFYGCDTGQACRDLQFSAGFDLPAGLPVDEANRWNAGALLGRVHLDDEGDPFLSHFVAGVDGMSRDSFDRLVDLWAAALADFTDRIGW